MSDAHSHSSKSERGSRQRRARRRAGYVLHRYHAHLTFTHSSPPAKDLVMSLLLVRVLCSAFLPVNHCLGFALRPDSTACGVGRFPFDTRSWIRTAEPVATRALSFGRWIGGSHSLTALRSKGQEEEEERKSSLILYGHPGTRSPLVNWACYELGIKDFVMAPDLTTNPHPFGQLPCLVHTIGGDRSKIGEEGEGESEVIVFESGAILQYLYTLHVERGGSVAPPTQMGSIFSWIAWANASLDPVCFLETPQGKVYDTGLRVDPANRKLKLLNALLSRQKYLLGDEFTVADVAVSSYLLYVVQFFPDVDLSPWPATQSYMLSCVERPSYRAGNELPARSVVVTSAKLSSLCVV